MTVDGLMVQFVGRNKAIAALRRYALSVSLTDRRNALPLIAPYAIVVAVLLVGSCVDVAVAQAPEVVFDLKIEKGKVAQDMRLIRVKQGDAVRLRWTADRPIVLHLHGYDIEKKVEPGVVAEMAFEARATGRFPVEEHKPSVKGGHAHGEAPLARIEVRPR
jgi:hypothetical protein